MEAPGDLCLVCENPNAQVCSRCKSARYCSKDCQKGDWATHKLLCAAFAAFTSARPTDQHFRAILFPVDQAKPQVIWIPAEWERDDTGPYQVARTSQFMGSDNGIARNTAFTYNPILKRELNDTIYISYRDGFLIDGSKPNRSIKAIMATKPGEHYDFRGPIVTFGMKGVAMDPSYCGDLDMNDFRHIADYFLDYDYKPLPETREPHETTVKGVRINCSGDEKVCGKPHFEAVDIPLSDSIFSEHFTSDIADRIGLPILTRKCSPDPKWSRGSSSDGDIPFNNQDATFLHLCCDPKANFNPRRGRWVGVGPQNYGKPELEVLLSCARTKNHFCHYMSRLCVDIAATRFHLLWPIHLENMHQMSL